MNLLHLGAIPALTAAVLAQSPLTTLTSASNYGNIGNAIYFDLHVNAGVVITAFDVPCGPNTVAGTGGALAVHVGPATYYGNTTNPAAWMPVAQATGLAVGPNATVHCQLAQGIPLAAGDHGIVLVASGFSHRYANGATCTGTGLPGTCSNSTFGNADLVLRAGAAQNVFLSGLPFQTRVFSGAIHYAGYAANDTLAAAVPMFLPSGPQGADTPARLRSLSDPLLGTTWITEVQAQNHTLAFLLGSLTGSAGLPFPTPCGYDLTLFVDPAAIVTSTLALLVNGITTIPLPLPSAPALVGLDLAMQAVGWTGACDFAASNLLLANAGNGGAGFALMSFTFGPESIARNSYWRSATRKEVIYENATGGARRVLITGTKDVNVGPLEIRNDLGAVVATFPEGTSTIAREIVVPAGRKLHFFNASTSNSMNVRWNIATD